MPFNCPCGEKLTLSQALHCAKDEYTHKRQEDPRQDVCYDVEVEPTHDNFVIEDNKSICPALSFVVQNLYSAMSNLNVAGKLSQSLEGTTPGEPIAMAMYGVAILLLLRLV